MTNFTDAEKLDGRNLPKHNPSNVMCFPNGRPNAPGKSSKNSNLLERQAIIFTVVLYIFICGALLGFHYAAEFEIISTTSIAEDAGEEVATSSSSSPYNPK